MCLFSFYQIGAMLYDKLAIIIILLRNVLTRKNRQAINAFALETANVNMTNIID